MANKKVINSVGRRGHHGSSGVARTCSSIRGHLRSIVRCTKGWARFWLPKQSNSCEPGARLIVIARAKEPFQVPAAAAQLDAFLRAIEKAGKNVTTTRLLKVDPLRVTSVPPGDFFDLMRQAGSNDVIVSFLGPPLLNDEQVSRLAGKRPRILALCSGAMPLQVDLRKMFERQLLLTAVISRTNAPARSTAGSAQAAFDQMFQVVTSANVAELPALAVARH